MEKLEEKYIMRPPGKEKVTYLRVIKEPFWSYRPERIVKHERKHFPLKVGDITWSYTIETYGDGRIQNIVLLEDNRHGVNFDPSCFETLEIANKRLNNQEKL